jgi:hypothetical protein
MTSTQNHLQDLLDPSPSLPKTAGRHMTYTASYETLTPRPLLYLAAPRPSILPLKQRPIVNFDRDPTSIATQAPTVPLAPLSLSTSMD